MSDIEALKRQGAQHSSISRLTGFDRTKIRKYLLKSEGTPVYGQQPPRQSKLDALKPYLEEHLKAGVWNAQVLLRELRIRSYQGGYTILKYWLHPKCCRTVLAGKGGLRRAKPARPCRLRPF